MKHEDFTSKYLTGLGVEIGAFKNPVPGISPIYVDKFAEFAAQPTRADYLGEATSLPFYDSSLNYIVASHVLEHSSNPIKALKEWFRVLKPKGIAYVIVPNKRFTWDRNRPTTDFEHMLEDYRSDTNDKDPTHIDDFIYGVVWQEIRPEIKPEDVDSKKAEHAKLYWDAIERGEDINIHFHVFTPESLKKILVETQKKGKLPYNWKILEFEDRFPDDNPIGILAILQKDCRQSLLEKAENFLRKMMFKSYPLKNGTTRVAQG